MLLYADEDFPYAVVELLRQFGRDVVTTQEDGLAGSPDPVILARAHPLNRAVLTRNRRHYERLHRRGAAHGGILSTTQDDDHAALAGRVHNALIGLVPGRWCVRVNKPPRRP